MKKFIDLNNRDDVPVDEIVYLNGLEVVRAVETTFTEELYAHTYGEAISAARVVVANIEVFANPGKSPNMIPFALFEGVYWECEEVLS